MTGWHSTLQQHFKYYVMVCFMSFNQKQSKFLKHTYNNLTVIYIYTVKTLGVSVWTPLWKSKINNKKY